MLEMLLADDYWKSMLMRVIPYPEDFSFIAFDNKAFNGSANLKAFKLCVGARWLDDIVSNNTINDR